MNPKSRICLGDSIDYLLSSLLCVHFALVAFLQLVIWTHHVLIFPKAVVEAKMWWGYTQVRFL